MQTILVSLKSNEDIKISIDYLLNFNPSICKSKYDREVLCMHFWIFSLSTLNLIKYPLNIWKSESPDFILVYPHLNKSVGIEHVRATSEVYKMAESKLLNSPQYVLIETGCYTSGMRPSRDNAINGLRGPLDKLSSAPSYGNSQEVEWCEYLIKSIKKKAALFSKVHFQEFASNELIIEDNSPCRTMLSLEIALELIKDDISDLQHPYSAIHVFSADKFILNIHSEPIVIDISKSYIRRLQSEIKGVKVRRNISIIVLLFSLLFIECAASQEELRATLSSWIGQRVEALIGKWGAPYETYQLQDGYIVNTWIYASQPVTYGGVYGNSYGN